MEKKKKGSFGKVIGVVLSLVLMALLAQGFVSQYPRMAKEAKKIYDVKLLDGDYGIAREYFSQVCELLYGFHVQYCQEVLGDERSPGEILMSGADRNYFGDFMPSPTPLPSEWYEDTPMVDESWEGYTENYQEWYDSMVAYWDEQYVNHFKVRVQELNLKYCIDRQSKQDDWYGTHAWEELTINQYPLVIRVHFTGGYPYVTYESKATGSQEIANYHYYGFIEETTYDNTVKAGAELLENCFLVVAADESLFSGEDDSLYYQDNWYYSEMEWECVNAVLEWFVYYVLAAVILVFFVALFLSIIKPLRLRELRISNLPLEVFVALSLLIVAFIIEPAPEMIWVTQMSVDYPGSYFTWDGMWKEIMVGGMEGKLLLLANQIVWTVLFIVLFFVFVSLLQIFYKRPMRFLKENTIIGRILCFFCRKGKQLVETVSKVDFNEKGNRKILIAVLLNFAITYGLTFLILWVMVELDWNWYGEDLLLVGGIFVFIVSLVYHILLYLFLMKKWNMIRLQYTELLETTEEMASGDTKVTYNGKSGIFHELQEKLARVQGGFDAAVQEEVKSQRMKSELITNVSHDLKTPLTAIITYVDLLKNEEISAEERREYVQVLETKSARLKTLIEDLFEVSKATSGNIKLNPQELDLVHLIQEVQLNLEDRIMQSGIQFKLTVPQEKVLVCLDGQKTCRIFENLFVNITKYGLYGSRAFVDVETLGEKVRVTIKNVSATEITYASDEIMERFTRGDASRNTEGSGLGLAIVKSFVEAQGGIVEIQLDGDLFKVIVEFPGVIRPKQDSAETVENPVETEKEPAEEVPTEVLVEVETTEEASKESIAEE